MVKENKIYKCEICGNTVSVIIGKEPPIICCSQPMILMEEKTGDEPGKEKHVPIIEKTEKGIKIRVGSVPHPMEETHFINLIQLIKDNEVVIGKRLKPGDAPEAEFCCLASTEGLKARILCNLHGVWVDA
jgi:superoxide reductase